MICWSDPSVARHYSTDQGPRLVATESLAATGHTRLPHYGGAYQELPQYVAAHQALPQYGGALQELPHYGSYGGLDVHDSEEADFEKKNTFYSFSLCSLNIVKNRKQKNI